MFIGKRAFEVVVQHTIQGFVSYKNLVRPRGDQFEWDLNKLIKDGIWEDLDELVKSIHVQMEQCFGELPIQEITDEDTADSLAEKYCNAWAKEQEIPVPSSSGNLNIQD